MKFQLCILLVFILFISCESAQAPTQENLEPRVTIIEDRLDSLIKELSKAKPGTTVSKKKSKPKVIQEDEKVYIAPATAQPKKTYTPTNSYTSSGQCQATTKKGAQCKRSVRSGSYCWQHGG